MMIQYLQGGIDIHFLEALADIIHNEWNKVRIMYAEPWGISFVVPPGERDDYEIHFLEQGSGEFCVGDRAYHITPGDIIVLHSMEGNSFRGDAEPFRFVYTTFCFDNPSNVQKIRELNRLMREESALIRPNEAFNIRRILYDIHGEIIARSIGHDLRMKLDLGALVIEILDTWNSEKNTDNAIHTISSNSYKLVNKVLVFLQNNYNSNIRLEDIGKLVNLHPGYICTLFRQITGKTINEFLCRFRIEKAKRLLLYTSLSITEIAYEVGYCSSQYFSKIFSRIEGMEPRRFRKTRRNI